jgi:uncharacterized protein (DUF2141 family)
LIASAWIVASAAPAAPLHRAGAAGLGRIIIEVANVRSNKGRVHVDLCTSAEFLHDCARSASAPARQGTTLVMIEGVPPGQYAAQAFFDENGNDKVDRVLFGIPTEGVGFSNDAPIRMAPPKFAAAAFDHDGDQTIQLRLRYFIGPDAPR